MILPSSRWAAVPRTSGAHDPRGVSRTGLARKWSNNQNTKTGFGEIRTPIQYKHGGTTLHICGPLLRVTVTRRPGIGTPCQLELYEEVICFKLAVRELRVVRILQWRRDLEHHGLHALLVILFQ